MEFQNISDLLFPPGKDAPAHLLEAAIGSSLAHLNASLEFGLFLRNEFSKELERKYGEQLPPNAQKKLVKLTVSYGDLTKLLTTSTEAIRAIATLNDTKYDRFSAVGSATKLIDLAVSVGRKGGDEECIGEMKTTYDGYEQLISKYDRRMAEQLVEAAKQVENLTLAWQNSDLKKWVDSVALAGIARKVGEYKSEKKRHGRVLRRRKDLRKIWETENAKFQALPKAKRINFAAKLLLKKSHLQGAASEESPSESHKKTVKNDLDAIYGKGGWA